MSEDDHMHPDDAYSTGTNIFSAKETEQRGIAVADRVLTECQGDAILASVTLIKALLVSAERTGKSQQIRAAIVEIFQDSRTRPLTTLSQTCLTEKVGN